MGKFSNCNGIVILCNKNKTGAIFKIHMLCLWSKFILYETFHKKKALFQTDMLEKCCAVAKSYWWHMEKISYWETC